MACPISRGESSWTKWSPATVTRSALATSRRSRDSRNPGVIIAHHSPRHAQESCVLTTPSFLSRATQPHEHGSASLMRSLVGRWLRGVEDNSALNQVVDIRFRVALKQPDHPVTIHRSQNQGPKCPMRQRSLLGRNRSSAAHFKK